MLKKKRDEAMYAMKQKTFWKVIVGFKFIEC